MTKIELETLSDLEWFDAICTILRTENRPTTRQLIELIGIEDTSKDRNSRGSKFLIPFDRRFKTASVNPDLLPAEPDKPIEFISVGGSGFLLMITDVLTRFPNYRIQRNTFDGGTQLFFHPVPDMYEFSAISFHSDRELDELNDNSTLQFHGISFHFGKNLILGRDGYHMK